MLEAMRFGWQKLLVNNVPHKGGGAGRPAAPPPVDYFPTWNKVVADETQVIDLQTQIVAGIKSLGKYSDLLYQVKLKAVQNNIAKAITLIDEAIALDATIPADWFGNQQSDRDANVTRMKSIKQQLLMSNVNDPAFTDVVSLAINQQLVILGQMGRVIGNPYDIGAEGLYPKGTWQYNLWELGYKHEEIAWVEGVSASQGLYEKYGSQPDLYVKELQYRIDEAIISKKQFEDPRTKDVTASSTTKPINSLNPVILPGYEYLVPSAGIDGVGSQTYQSLGRAAPAGFTDKAGNPLTPGTIEVYYGSDGKVYNHTTDTFTDWLRYEVPVNVSVSKSPWTKVQRPIETLPAPIPPTINYPIGTIEYGRYSRRQIRKRYTGSGGGWTPPTLNPVNPFKNPLIKDPYIDGVRQPVMSLPYNPIGWCGTGRCGGAGQPMVINASDANFTDALMGQGYTPDIIDTVRRQLRSTKIKGRANLSQIALQMAAAISSGSPDVGGNVPSTAQTAGSSTSQAATWHTDIGQDSIIRMSVRSQLQARRARRGLFG